MAMAFAAAKLSFVRTVQHSETWRRRRLLKPTRCTPSEHVPEPNIDIGILCEPCKGKGWLVCDFCKGQKTNVRAENNRIYRRCPSCRAVGYVLCPKCKVFKCVTFPNYTDGEEMS